MNNEKIMIITSTIEHLLIAIECLLRSNDKNYKNHVIRAPH